MLLIHVCQNAAMRGAWISIYYVFCSKTYSTFDGLVLVPHWFALGVPAFVKLLLDKDNDPDNDVINYYVIIKHH